MHAPTNGTFWGTAESFAHFIVFNAMGPILQEQTASATLRKLSGKEKVRMKNAENTGIVAR